MADSSADAGYFIYVTQVYFCGKYPVCPTICSQSDLFSAMCKGDFLLKDLEAHQLTPYSRRSRYLGLARLFASRMAFRELGHHTANVTLLIASRPRFGRHTGPQLKLPIFSAGLYFCICISQSDIGLATGSLRSFLTFSTHSSRTIRWKPAKRFTEYVNKLFASIVIAESSSSQIPVALAMWNQVGSECMLSRSMLWDL